MADAEVDAAEVMRSNKKLQSAQKKIRLEQEHEQKLGKLFEYYAGTTVPVDRVAEHMGVSVDFALRGLIKAGRTFNQGDLT